MEGEEVSWSARPPEEPMDRWAVQPAIELSVRAPTPLSDVPAGDVSCWMVDGSPCDLSESHVEGWSRAGGEVTVTVIVPADESPEPGVPMRITLALLGSEGAHVEGRWAADDDEPGLHVDELRWDGERFRLSA